MAEYLPGSPDARQLAAADQKHAAVVEAVDRLVVKARDAGPGTDGWIRFIFAEVVDAADRVSGDDDESLEPAALALAAEAVLRLARREGRAQDILGIAPDYTGELSTQEHIDQERGRG